MRKPQWGCCLWAMFVFGLAGPAWSQEPTEADETAGEVAGAVGEAMEGEPAAVQPALQIPDKLFEDYLGKFKRKQEARIAYLPAMQLRWAIRNKATASGGAFRKAYSSKEIHAPADQELLQRVLVALQDDLAAKLRAAGWEVHTLADLGSEAPQLKPAKADRKTGLPMHRSNNGVSEHDFLLVGLPGTEPAQPANASYGMEFAKFLKGRKGLNLSVAYEFAPGTVGETSSRMLGTEAGGGLWFTARADLAGAETGGWGNINIKPQGMVVADDIGTLEEIAGSRTSKAESVIRFVGGVASSDRAGFTITPDWPRVEAEMVRAGQAFNSELVARLP